MVKQGNAVFRTQFPNAVLVKGFGKPGIAVVFVGHVFAVVYVAADAVGKAAAPHAGGDIAAFLCFCLFAKLQHIVDKSGA